MPADGTYSKIAVLATVYYTINSQHCKNRTSFVASIDSDTSTRGLGPRQCLGWSVKADTSCSTRWTTNSVLSSTIVGPWCAWRCLYRCLGHCVLKFSNTVYRHIRMLTVRGGRRYCYAQYHMRRGTCCAERGKMLQRGCLQRGWHDLLDPRLIIVNNLHR
jgi:hypothetical protein